MKANIGYSRERHSKSSNLYKEAIALLRQHRIFPRKRFGQNFAVEDSLLHSMIAYADLSVKDIVFEVGAGLGFLTRLLSPISKEVIAVEIDKELTPILRTQLKGFKNINLIEGDVLASNIAHFDKVVSTPPYSISSPLLFWLLDRSFKAAVLTFQEEFARRLTAAVGTKDYSRLTVAAYYRADVELLEHVPRTAFYPPPDVDSTIVRLKPKPAPFRVKDEKTFIDLVRGVFTQRNKKLRNAVMPFLSAHGIAEEKAREFADSLTFHDKRVRELAPEDFGALTNEILEKESLLR